MEKASIKIENAMYILTVDDKRRIIQNGAIAISGQRIIQVGTTSDLKEVAAERIIDAKDKVITPGFCNGHVHISYAHAVRGLFPDDLIREEYVAKVFELQSKMTEEEEYFTSLLAIIELVKYGTTTFLDPGSTKFLDACLEAYDKTGCRIILGKQVLDKSTSLKLPKTSTDEAIKIMEDCISKYDHILNDRVRAWAMPFSSRLSSKELLCAAKALADKFNTGLTLHQNFGTTVIQEEFVNKYGKRPVELLDHWEVLGHNVLLSHVTGLNEVEIECMSKTLTKGICCPSAAMKLGIGLVKNCLLPEMLNKGICFGLGTDAGNNSNLIDTMRAMYLVSVMYKDGIQNTQMIPAESALEMATINGATSLGLNKEIGSIELGKKADLILFDTNRPEWQAIINPINNLIYNADGRSVHTVIIDGKILVENYQVTFVDEIEVIKKVQNLSKNLLSRTGISYTSRWPIS